MNADEIVEEVEAANLSPHELDTLIGRLHDLHRQLLLKEAEADLAEARAACTCDPPTGNYDPECRVADTFFTVERLKGNP